MDLFFFVHLVLQSRSHLVYPRHQEGFARLGNQALWVNLKVGCPGGVGSQCSDTQQLLQWKTAATQVTWLGGHSPPVLSARVFLS